MRPSGRAADELRPVQFIVDYTRHAAGSVLAAFGDTRVLCTASVENRVPPWLRGAGTGWVTGEYGMLPGSTHTRSGREAARGKQSGRTQPVFSTTAIAPRMLFIIFVYYIKRVEQCPLFFKV